MRGFAPPNHQEREKERFWGLQLLAGREIPAAVSALRAERQPLSPLAWGRFCPARGSRVGPQPGQCGHDVNITVRASFSLHSLGVRGLWVLKSEVPPGFLGVKARKTGLPGLPTES